MSQSDEKTSFTRSYEAIASCSGSDADEAEEYSSLDITNHNIIIQKTNERIEDGKQQQQNVNSNNRCWKLRKSFDFSKQLFIALIIGTCNILRGTCDGWTANLPNIQEDNTTSFNISIYDVRWLVSAQYIVALPANLIGGPLGDVTGPKTMLSIAMPFAIFFWFSLAYAPSLVLLNLGRASLGFIFGLITPLVGPLISEMTEPRVRGFAIGSTEAFSGLGNLLGYIQAGYFPWRSATLLSIVPLVPCVLILPFIYESPYWYTRHGNLKKADKSLNQILGSSRAHKKSDILQNIQNTVNCEKKPTLVQQIRQLKQKENWRPLLLLLVILILRETGGKSVVFLYTVYTFRSAGVVVDPFTCTLYVGIARLVAVFICALVIDKIGRKKLLLASSFLSGLCLASAGLAMISGIDNSLMRTIPLISILIFVVVYSIGLSPIPWILMGEILPLPVKSLATSIACFIYSIFLFIMASIFPFLLKSVQLGPSFLMFCISYVVIVILVAKVLPETKMKDITDMQKIFKSKEILTLSRRNTLLSMKDGNEEISYSALLNAQPKEKNASKS